MNTLHIMHVVFSLDVGGLEHVVLALAQQSLLEGDRVSVLCLDAPGKLAELAEQRGARVECLHRRPGLQMAFPRQVSAALAADVPDIVHTHQIGALFYAGRAARRAGVGAVIHTEHGKHYETSTRRRWLAWWAARAADRFCCVSRDIAAAVNRYGIVDWHHTLVVPNGIDPVPATADEGLRVRRELEIPQHACVVGTVGRLAEVKRQDVLLRGCAAAARTLGRPLHVLLVGAGPCAAGLRTLADQLGIAPHVHLAGHQPDPRAYLRAMDMFALTSRSEGMPLAVLEAWAAGLPVIGARVGGLPELIAEGRTGLLFPAGDETAFAACVARLLGDVGFACALGDNGRELVRTKFDRATMSRTYRNLYLSVLEAAPCPA